MPETRSVVRWLRKLFEPRTPTRGDFFHVSRNGTVRFDWVGWLRTPEGRAEWDAQTEKMRAFEKFCRERDPEGKFRFYD
jgi:hypothetical protein